MPDRVTAVVKGLVVYRDDGGPVGSFTEFTPPDPGHFGVHLQVFIGPAATEPSRSDSFDIRVCTPSWLGEQLAPERWSRLRHGSPAVLPEAVAGGAGVWLVRRWDAAELEGALRASCDACSPGPDWGSVASRIGRVAPWEFAYRYDRHVDDHYGSPYPPVRSSPDP